MSTSLLSRLLTLPADDRPAAFLTQGSNAATLSLRDWKRRVEAHRRATAASGAQRIYLFSEDALETSAALFGAWAAGAAVVLGAEALDATLERLAREGLLEPGRDAVALDACTACAERLGFKTLCPADIDGIDADPILPELSDDALLLELFTGGTTGSAKCVQKRLGQLFLEAEGVGRALLEAGMVPADGPEPVVLATVTQQHIYGMLFRMLWPLSTLVDGRRVLLTAERFHYPEALEAAMRCAADAGREVLLMTSPSHLSRLEEERFASLPPPVGIASSAAPLDDAGALRCRNAFGRFPLEVLGSTETGGIARRIRVEGPGGLLTPVWRPMPGVAVSVVTDEGSIAAEGIGTVRVAGPQIASPEGETGADRICLTPEGFRLLGRTDRILKIEGKRVDPAKVEAALCATGLFGSVRVFADPDSTRGRLACAAEITNASREALLLNGKASFLKELRGLLADKLTPVELPKRWRFLEALPVNARGKTTAADLAALFDPRSLEWLRVSDEAGGVPGAVRTVKLRARLPETLAWFEGHFPGLPILPGVAQLLLVERALAGLVPELGVVESVKNLKFKAVTKPLETMELTLALSDVKADGARSVTFLWESIKGNESGESPERILHARGTLMYTSRIP